MSVGRQAAAVGIVVLGIILILWLRRRKAGAAPGAADGGMPAGPGWNGPYDGWVEHDGPGGWEFVQGASLDQLKADLVTRSGNTAPITLILDKAKGPASAYWGRYAPNAASASAPADKATWQYWVYG